MKKLALLVMAAVLVTGGCALGGMSGSGNLQTRQYDIKDFTGVEAGWAFQVTITRSNTYSVSVTIDDNLLDNLIVDRSGSTLRIRLKAGYIYNAYTARVEITMPDIRSIELSGASTGTVSGFNSSGGFIAKASGAGTINLAEMVFGENIRLEVSGASRVNGSIVTGGDARFTASGASSITLSGSADNLDADASGASHLGLDDFGVNDASVNLSGASNGTVNLDGTLDADVSGASHLFYIGEPKMGDINTSGGSGVSKK